MYYGANAIGVHEEIYWLPMHETSNTSSINVGELNAIRKLLSKEHICRVTLNICNICTKLRNILGTKIRMPS